MTTASATQTQNVTLTRQRIAELRMACQLTPDSIPAHQEAVNAFLAAGLTGEALPFLRRLAILCPDDIEAGMQLSAILGRHGDDAGALEQARRVAALAPDRIDLQHNLGVAACRTGDYDAARTAFERKLSLDPQSYETCNDLAVIHTLTDHPDEAARAYMRCLEINPRYEKGRDNALQYFWDRGQFSDGLNLVESLLEKVGPDPDLSDWQNRFSQPPGTPDTIPMTGSVSHHLKGLQTRVLNKKLAFVASSDAFLKPIMAHFARDNEVRVFSGNSRDDLAELLRWADLTWLEWCDGLAVEASRLPKSGKTVCRLHSYEVFTDAPAQMNWRNIDGLITVNRSVEEILDQHAKPPVRRAIIHNGVDPVRFPFNRRQPRGKKIAYVGYINYKKNPSLLLQTFKAIHDWDPEFEFHIAGEHQDPRIKLYFDHLLPRLNLPITFHGWVGDMPGFYAGMDYVISTSLFESFHYSIAEGMLSGCLPLIHSWMGADQLYPPEAIFDTPHQAIDLLKKYAASDHEQMAHAYRDLIVSRYNWTDRLNEIDLLLHDIMTGENHRSRRRANLVAAAGNVARTDIDYGLVSIIILASNDAKDIKDAVTTALGQTYRHTEIIVCDDGSTDVTEEQLKPFADKIILIRQLHRGPASALNAAIQQSRGQFIAPLRASEAFAPDKIEKQVERLAAAPELGMIGCACDLVDDDLGMKEPEFSEVVASWAGGEVAEQIANLPLSAVMFRRRLLDQAGWFEETSPDPEIGQEAIQSMWRHLAEVSRAEILKDILVYVRPESRMAASSGTFASPGQPGLDRWSVQYRSLRERSYPAPSQSVADPAPKTGAKIVFVGAVDPGGQMAMWVHAINRHTRHQARLLTHTETMGFPSDLVIKRGGYAAGSATGCKPVFAVLEEAAEAVRQADLVIFAAGLAPGAARADVQLTDTDEQPFGTIHWPDILGKKRRAAILFGTPSVCANLPWYRDHFAAKGWPILTCEPDIHRWLTEAHFVPRLLSRSGETYQPDPRDRTVIAIVHRGGDQSHEGRMIVREAAAAIKKHNSHVAFGSYHDMPWTEVLAMKKRAHIGIDCISVGTGRFGLDSLENSALGLVNVVYCNTYTRALIAQTIGTSELPWESPATLAELVATIDRYVAEPAALSEAMEKTRTWFETCWDEKVVIQRWDSILNMLS